MSNAPPPKRKRRLLKVLLAVAAVLLSLIGIIALAAAIWRGKERAQLAKRFDAVRALGQPIEIADFVEPDVPDDQNIVPLIRAAAAAVGDGKVDDELDRRLAELWRVSPAPFMMPLTAEELAVTRASVTANAKALAIIAPADSRPGVAWHDPFFSPLITWNDPSYSQIRKVSYALEEAARLSASEGRSDTVVEALLDIEAVGAAMRHKPSVLAALVGIGTRTTAANDTIKYCPDLHIGTAAGEVRPERAMRLLACLADDNALRQQFRDGLIGERVSIHDGFRSRAAGKAYVPGMPVASTFGDAFMDRNESVVLDYLAESMRLIDAPSRAEFDAGRGELTRIETDVASRPTLVLAATWLPSMQRIYETQYRALTDRHLAAATLAIRLYQVDHAGARPETLAALVPDYLPRVPTDRIDGKPLRYDPKRAIVWSVGDDAVDQGGDPTVVNATRWIDRWKLKDAVVYLDRRPRPATQPAPAE